MQAVILCGGLGTRLGELTHEMPKPMVSVWGRPFLEWQVKYLQSVGFQDFVLLTGYHAEKIEQHFGDGHQLGVRIRYSRETQPLGTGGALAQALDLLENQFWLFFGDSFLPLTEQELIGLQSTAAAPVVMAVYDNRENTDVPFNVCLLRDGTVTAYDKTGAASDLNRVEAGVYGVSKDVLSSLADQKQRPLSFESQIVTKLIPLGQVKGQDVAQRFYDIGTPQRLEEFATKGRALLAHEGAQPKVLAIIVDYYNQEKASALSLKVARSCPVIHVDSASQPPIQLTEEQKQAGVRLLRVKTNLGYSGAINKAVENYGSDYDYLWLLNPDLDLDDGCYDYLLRTLQSNPLLAVVGPRVLVEPGSDQVWGSRGGINVFCGTTYMSDWQSAEPLPPHSYVPGCAIMVRKTAWDEVHGMPTHYKLYYDETAFCLDLERRGWQMAVVPSATVYHNSDSFKGRFPARHLAYFFVRNNLRFWKDQFDRSPWRQFPTTLWIAFKEICLPLRRAPSVKVFVERLIYLGAGLWDALRFVHGKPPRFEKTLFPDMDPDH